jgi:hypothetical protein
MSGKPAPAYGELRHQMVAPSAGGRAEAGTYGERAGDSRAEGGKIQHQNDVKPAVHEQEPGREGGKEVLRR